MADKTPTKRPEPTASEAMFFFAIVKHTRNRADIDWDAVAQEQGFKNAEVAKVRLLSSKKHPFPPPYLSFLSSDFIPCIGSLWSSQAQARHRPQRHPKEGQQCLSRGRLDSQQGPQDAHRPYWNQRQRPWQSCQEGERRSRRS